MTSLSSTENDAALVSNKVEEQTLTFWLQNISDETSSAEDNSDKANTNNNTSSLLLTEADCPLPSIEQVLQTVSPFQSLAQQDTEYLKEKSSSLIEVRDSVRKCKKQIDEIGEVEYKRVRDVVFPLGKSGPMSKNVQNRAAYKLLESMEEIGITKKLFGDVEEVRRKMSEAKAQERTKRAKAEQGKSSKQAAKDKRKAMKKLVKIHPRDVVFVDVCGGPGGFSQAILDELPKLPNTKVRGYGMTLDFVTENNCDLNWYPKLKKRRDFTPTYGLDGTGNVYNPANVESLVSVCSFEKRIHLVMEDGGFEVSNDQVTMQESITSRIVYSQWYIALRLLSEGGSLVLKLFETSSVFLRSMLTLSCLFFRQVAIVKPAHSRVINSERYLSCSGFRKDAFSSQWMNFLQQVHARAFMDNSNDDNNNGEGCGGQAPFTLLPNMSLVIGKNNRPVVEKILSNLEESIITTATRQVAGFQMIFDEAAKKPDNVSGTTTDEKEGVVKNIDDEGKEVSVTED